VSDKECEVWRNLRDEEKETLEWGCGAAPLEGNRKKRHEGESEGYVKC